MRHIEMRHIVVAIFLTVVLLSSADGKPRPTVDDPNGDTCWKDKTTDKGCGGLLCWCCYDDGCWICGAAEPTCVWDPAYRAIEPPSVSPGGGQSPIKQPNDTVVQTGPLSISPESRQSLIKPPSVPSIPSGPTTGTSSTSYSYSTSTTDPNGDQVRYTFDWGDGTNSTTSLVNPGAKASLSHRWARTGTYLVKAMATNSKGATSAWSNTLSVKISTTRHAPEEAQGQELKGGA